MNITDNPELLATFDEEARERLASLASGLLALESAPPSRSAIAALFRDAHTIKGSARMMGLTSIVELAHVAEDLLAAVRDRRLTPGRELVDLLLASVDGMTRSLPAASDPLSDEDRAALREALLAALTGKPIVPLPRSDPAPPAAVAEPAPEPESEAEPEPETPVAVAVPVPVETVRVAVPRIHDLLNVVGEAEVDARRVERATNELASAMAAVVRGGDKHLGGLEALLPAAAALRELVEDHAARVARLRGEAMSLAMVPLARLVAGFPRLVRDLAGRTGKQVHLELEGEDVELDKRVLDTIGEALGHLVTNAVDHGCESPEQRVAAGKPEAATVWVRARAAGASVIIEVADDGGGIDRAAVHRAAVAAGLVAADAPSPADAERREGASFDAASGLDHIFAPALSTRSTVSESSGRGVGLDVVRATVEGLGGQIAVTSTPGSGTRFILTLPVSLGILRCLLCRVGGERYAIPLPSVSETRSLRGGAAAEVSHFAGSDLLIRDGSAIPLLDLAEILGSFNGSRARRAARKPSAALLTSTAGRRPLAWAVDGLEGEADLVVTDLGPFLSGAASTGRHAGGAGVTGASGLASAVTGASILDDGSVVCLLDLRALGSAVGVTARVRAASSMPPGGVDRRIALPAPEPEETPRALRILVVEDSVGVRELERSLLATAGYAVDTAVDGVDGVAHLTGEPYDLIVTDVEMPGMDGLALTRTVRATPGWQAVPVVVMTSRDSEADRRAGMDAGADAYLHKSDFSASDLLGTVARLLGGFS
ncbi:MAG TPA: response regulator [Frankiaceae bacterium]|nr:response regulator [Frankiaceae bacterium]